MKSLLGFTASTLGAVAVALLLAVAPAHAFVLNQWNVSEFEAAGATVTVTVSLLGGNTVVDVSFNPGTLSNTLLGIDDFGYQSNNNCCLAGSTAGFTFTKDGNADGFGKFLRETHKPSGDDLTLHFIIAGDRTGDLNTADDFAGHVRFSGNCSGWFGGHNVATTSDSGCTSTVVAEPAVLALAGFGFVGLGLATRRWRKK